ncbi:MAG: aminoacetone oxidase family FAD-binding enzyme [Candidatus Cloacimonadaceae bacterium]|nr:aminoacetone oxidase family FAD-binding enzyme [Candidatus Cloacimonadaceae bacterium]
MKRLACVIIGAGPAGLAAAISSSVPCLILERNLIAGKKLLLSGSGQCNFTHDLSREEFLLKCGQFGAFLKPSLFAMDSQGLIDLMTENGCPVAVRADGKVFPASFNAEDVRDTLLRLVLAKGSRIEYDKKVVKVFPGEGFQVICEDGSEYQCRKLIIAGGGCSYPQTGSDGSAMELTKQLGHKIVKPRPALASVKIRAYKSFVSCSGISLKRIKAILINPLKRFVVEGDILFTHSGLSGPLILDNSHLLSGSDRIILELLPRAEQRIPLLLDKYARQNLLNCMKHSGLPEALILALLSTKNIDPAQPAAQVKKTTRFQIVSILSHLEFTVNEIESLSTSMLTAGGVSLKEVRAQNLESKLHPGLHFAGEILDYNLPSGGFNIQAAISTGWLAGLCF